MLVVSHEAKRRFSGLKRHPTSFRASLRTNFQTCSNLRAPGGLDSLPDGRPVGQTGLDKDHLSLPVKDNEGGDGTHAVFLGQRQTGPVHHVYPQHFRLPVQFPF